MTAAIKLSVALVTRDRPDWLRQCLEGWRAQSVQPFEIVVSDDSTKSLQADTRKVTEEFGARWVEGPRRGLYANRNNAFRSAKGTHIMSADDDHTHPDDFVRSILGAIESDPEAVWTVTERSPENPVAPLEPPGELRSNGTIGPPEDVKHSAAIACGSSCYPRQIFERGLYYNETYSFGGMWYLWGHQLRRAGFRVRFWAETFVWHHTESSNARRNDVPWMTNQLECNLFVQVSHAFRVSRTPAAIGRAVRDALRLWWSGGTIFGNTAPVRLSPRQIVRAFSRGIRTPLPMTEARS